MERDIAGGSDAVTGRPYFQVWENDGGDWYFNFKAANHEIILQSEGYSARSGALNGVLSTLDNGLDARRYEVVQAGDGQWFFRLKAAHGRIIGSSEDYPTRQGAERGMQAVVRNVGEYQDWLANRTGARFDVFRGNDGRYYFNLHAANGEIVLSSQGYTTEESALSATFSVAENGIDPARYEVNASADGGAYFNLKAANGQIIGTSEVYVSTENAQRAVDGVIALLPSVELL
jgi:uncharacterized protein YegP (UPF0339 family)